MWVSALLDSGGRPPVCKGSPSILLQHRATKDRGIYAFVCFSQPAKPGTDDVQKLSSTRAEAQCVLRPRTSAVGQLKKESRNRFLR